MRASGILLPVASLPSRYGIGCFSKEAYEFVDRLEEAGQSYWQILPLGPTGYGDSPYQSFSTFAGNPYFIDLETLVKEGLLTEEEMTVYHRGRNAKSYTSAKNQSIGDYRKATGLEALCGYLYLSGRTMRVLELVQYGIEHGKIAEMKKAKT